MFTVAFFGQKYVDNPLTVVKKLEEPIRKSIIEHGQVNFIVGGKNEADQCCAMAVRRVRKEFAPDSAKLSLIESYNPYIESNAP